MRLALISDIHEDLMNLQQVFRHIEKANCEHVVCLGDISGFSLQYHRHLETRNASECLRLIRENCSVIIPGNHDLHAIQKTPNCNSGFTYPINWYELNIEKQAKIAGEHVWLYNDGELNAGFTDIDYAYLRSLPEFSILSKAGLNILFTHFIYPNLTGSLRQFYYENKDYDLHKKFMAMHDCQLSFSGHRHYLGLLISSAKLLAKRYNKKYNVKIGDCVLVPPVVGNQFESGFCIFDTDAMTVIAKYI